MSQNYKVRSRIISHICLVIVSLYTIFPLIIIFSMAFKSNQEILFDVLRLPKTFSLDAILDVWNRSNFKAYFINSLVVVIPHILIITVLTVMVSYGLIFTKIPHANIYFSFLLVGFMIPVQAIIIPLFHTTSKLGLINSRLTLSIYEVAMYIPFCIFLLRSFFKNIPMALVEAARIDGANSYQLISKILLNISKPAIFTIIILQFKNSWNEFLLPLVIIQQERMQTLPQGFSRLQGGRYTLNYNSIGAAALIVSIPMIIVFLVFQGRFIQGLAGAVKE